MPYNPRYGGDYLSYYLTAKIANDLTAKVRDPEMISHAGTESRQA